MNNTDIHLGLMKCISRLWTIWQYIMETMSMLNVLHFAFTKIFFGNLLLLVIIIQQKHSNNEMDAEHKMALCTRNSESLERSYKK